MHAMTVKNSTSSKTEQTNENKRTNKDELQHKYHLERVNTKVVWDVGLNSLQMPLKVKVNIFKKISLSRKYLLPF